MVTGSSFLFQSWLCAEPHRYLRMEMFWAVPTTPVRLGPDDKLRRLYRSSGDEESKLSVCLNLTKGLDIWSQVSTYPYMTDSAMLSCFAVHSVVCPLICARFANTCTYFECSSRFPMHLQNGFVSPFIF